LQELQFNTVFKTKRVSEIYESYFDSSYMTGSVSEIYDSGHVIV